MYYSVVGFKLKGFYKGVQYMGTSPDNIKKSERISAQIRGLYEQYGYEKFRMGKFEEYDFYTGNKDFLSSGQILTFTDLSGRLMALKPDVTMSIVKRTRAAYDAPERLYYSESIYRASQEVKEYKEIYQIGLEFIGEVTPYINAEIITLALKSLSLTGGEFILDISHMGFLNGIIDEIEAPSAVKKSLLRCVENKNAHDLNALAVEHNLKSKHIKNLTSLIEISSDMGSALKKAAMLDLNEPMKAALNELELLYKTLGDNMHKCALRLDFSMTLDSKYYNGLIFRGYINGVPRAVLSGGRYDKLLSRMGKHSLEAIGFAIYFDEIERFVSEPVEGGYDAVVLYDEGVDYTMLYNEAERLIESGNKLYVGRTLPGNNGGNPVVYKFIGGELRRVNND